MFYLSFLGQHTFTAIEEPHRTKLTLTLAPITPLEVYCGATHGGNIIHTAYTHLHVPHFRSSRI